MRGNVYQDILQDVFSSGSQEAVQFYEIYYKRCRAAIITKKLVDNNSPAQITRILINAKLILMIMFILFPLCGLWKMQWWLQYE
jgi:uncharacterized protein (DUF111 family)